MKKITILIPTYNEEEVSPALMDALKQVTQSLEQYHFEFLFVDDGSTDETTTLLQQFHAENSHVQYVELSRNFGKEIAMLAGFDYADGDAVIIMDADLQHPPDMIPELIHWWKKAKRIFKRSVKGKEKKIHSNLGLQMLTTLFYRV